MTRPVYNLLFRIFFALSAPYYFMRMWRRGNWREGFGQRFGKFQSRLKHRLTNSSSIWFHAVSVGEVNICLQLIQAIEPRLPHLKIVVSTTTSTGMEQLRQRLPAHILKIYYPVDFKKAVYRSLGVIRPKAVVLVEAEIWPNFLWSCFDRKIPVFLVNARVSDRSFRGYQRFGNLFRPIFAKFSGVGAQNTQDADRLKQLGFPADRIHILGNMKFDAARVDSVQPIHVRILLEQLGVTPSAPILLGGSTHAGEEAILAEIYQRLRKDFPSLFLILVPRHFERGKAVAGELEKRNVRFVYRSEMTANLRKQPGELDCLLVNTTGELRYFYEAATVVFVGKTLTAEGGQNPIEPAALEKALVFGPNTQNFTAISDELVRKNGALRVANAAELEKAVHRFLSSPEEREQFGKNGKAVVQANVGAVERTVEMIVDGLK